MRHAAIAALMALALTTPARADDVDMREAFRPSPVAQIAGSRATSGQGGQPRLVATALRDLGRGNFTGVGGAWCGRALAAWLRRAGYSSAGSARAIDYARIGRPTVARPGVIAVSRRHVGVVVSVGVRGVVLVSGNWSNRVRVHLARGVIAFREPV